MTNNIVTSGSTPNTVRSADGKVLTVPEGWPSAPRSCWAGIDGKRRLGSVHSSGRWREIDELPREQPELHPKHTRPRIKHARWPPCV